MTDSLRTLVDHWLAREQHCQCGVTHTVRTRIVRFDDDAGHAVVDALRQLELGPRVLVVSDTVIHAAAAATIGVTLRNASFDVVDHVFETNESNPLATDEETVAKLNSAFRDCQPNTLIGVGSGTINDLCKCVASKNDVAYVACPTAASMNGYTSTVASLKRGGLKTTEPVRAPDAVVVDLNVLMRSPPAMTAAGVADLMSKFVCNADWSLARLIEGAYYCHEPARLASRAADAVVDDLEAISRGERGGLETLSAALILSGMSMAMAGSSSPASGGEHLISHYWDMTLPPSDHPRLHGEQVGVGSILCATLYETLRRIDPATIDPHAIAERAEPFERLERDLRDHFGHAADAVIEQARRKHLPPAAAQTRAAFIKDHWDGLWREVAPTLKSRDVIVSILERAGAPVSLRRLDLDERAGAAALAWARHIRARYTVLDFAAEIGFFNDEHQQAMLRGSGALTAP